MLSVYLGAGEFIDESLVATGRENFAVVLAIQLRNGGTGCDTVEQLRDICVVRDVLLLVNQHQIKSTFWPPSKMLLLFLYRFSLLLPIVSL